MRSSLPGGGLVSYTTPDPKPAPRAKAKWRKPMRRIGNTKYARRERQWGFMAFQRSRGCRVPALWIRVGECSGPVQFMHLGPKLAAFRKCPDDQGNAGCASHHDAIDNAGGFYGQLSSEARWKVRWLLIVDAQKAWNALTDAERAHWATTAAQRLSNSAAVGEDWDRRARP